MASLSLAKGQRWLIEEYFGGKRRKFCIGSSTKVPKKYAEEVRRFIGRMAEARRLGQPYDSETQYWLERVQQEKLGARFVKLGLFQRRPVSTLAAFVDSLIAGLGKRKESTLIFYNHTRRNLIEFFGEQKQLRDITAGEAKAFKEWLDAKQGLAINTIRRRCSVAKHWFGHALHSKLIDENPFGVLKGLAVRGNGKRAYFVSDDEARKVLAACPDAQWRLLFGLCRYGGLRCPSEVLALRWCDLAWERYRMLVRSPKTEHHEGKEDRWVPIFPELVPLFDEARRENPEALDVITKYRHTNVNLRTQFLRIIEAAGLKPWPKVFQNLRSTRETELVNAGWPEAEVCRWIGNSRAVAREHYLQATDEMFAAAAGKEQVQKRVKVPPNMLPNQLVEFPVENGACVFVGSFVGSDGIAG